MNGRMRITADRHPWSRSIELRVGVEVDGGGYAAARPLVMEVLPEGHEVEPCIRLKPEAAQELMDELWRTGLRPSQEEGSTGQAAATQRHLDDMRALAFHALKVPK